MEKKNNTWIIVLLVLIILGLVGYICFDKFFFKKQKIQNTSEIVINNNDDEKVYNEVVKLFDAYNNIDQLFEFGLVPRFVASFNKDNLWDYTDDTNESIAALLMEKVYYNHYDYADQTDYGETVIMTEIQYDNLKRKFEITKDLIDFDEYNKIAYRMYEQEGSEAKYDFKVVKFKGENGIYDVDITLKYKENESAPVEIYLGNMKVTVNTDQYEEYIKFGTLKLNKQ